MRLRNTQVHRQEVNRDRPPVALNFRLPVRERTNGKFIGDHRATVESGTKDALAAMQRNGLVLGVLLMLSARTRHSGS
jgi:hypothetical protein